jgi:hypothetical protein
MGTATDAGPGNTTVEIEHETEPIKTEGQIPARRINRGNQVLVFLRMEPNTEEQVRGT